MCLPWNIKEQLFSIEMISKLFIEHVTYNGRQNAENLCVYI